MINNLNEYNSTKNKLTRFNQKEINYDTYQQISFKSGERG